MQGVRDEGLGTRDQQELTPNPSPLPTRERLGHVDLAIEWHRIAEVLAVKDLTAVYEDHHVWAHSPLLIEHVRPRAWVTAEDCVQRLANRVTLDARGRAGDVTLDVGRKGYSGHG